MASLVKSGRTAIAESISTQPVHLAWGSGSEQWDGAFVQESVDAISLTNEIGRRMATSIQFAVPDEDGDIIVPVFNDPTGGGMTRRFRSSSVPTAHLYMRFNFDFEDAPASVIRELGVFINTSPVAGLPAGQRYFTPAQIQSPGTLLALENLREKIIRSPNARQSFEFVLSI